MEGVYLYKNLLFLRKREGLIQAEMQEWCGISGATWSNYENGKTDPDIQTIIKISRSFKVSIDDLLTVDMQNVDLIEKYNASKNRENVDPIVDPIVDPKDKTRVYSEYIHGIRTLANDPENVYQLAVIGQLRVIEEKLDQIKSLAEKAAKK